MSEKNWREFCLRVFWNGGSTFDAWLNICSAKIATRMLTIPQSFAQMGLPSAIVFMLAQGAIGIWTQCTLNVLYLKYIQRLKTTSNEPGPNHTTQQHEVFGGLLGPIWKAFSLLFHLCTVFYVSFIQFLGCSNSVYFLNNELNKRTWVLVLSPIFALSVLVPRAQNYRVWSFIGVITTIFMSGYLTAAPALYTYKKSSPDVRYSSPRSYHEFYNGLSGLLFLGHVPIPVELMDAMWKPQEYKMAYAFSIVYVLMVTMPPAISMYLRFGDELLPNTNALSLLPRSSFRDTAIVLLVMHVFVSFGMYSLSLYTMWEKLVRVHDSPSYVKRTLWRLPVFLGVLLMAVAFPFFGFVNRLLDSVLASWNLYIIPCAAYNMVIWGGKGEKVSVTRLGWVADFSITVGVIIWMLVVECALGMWGDLKAYERKRFHLFDKCYKCK